MNKKGFTMIELLATIVILGILSTIGVASTTQYVTQSRVNSYKLMSEAAYEAAMNCVIKGGCDAPIDSDNPTQYTTQYLISNGYLDNLKNPRGGNNDCSGTVIISVITPPTETTEYKKYTYKVELDCPGFTKATLEWPYSKTADVDDIILNKTP